MFPCEHSGRGAIEAGRGEVGGVGWETGRALPGSGGLATLLATLHAGWCARIALTASHPLPHA